MLSAGAGALATVTFAAWLSARARHRTEEALRRSEKQFRQGIVNAPFPVLMHAEDGEVLALSRAWTHLSGYTLQDIPTFGGWLERACGPAGEAMAEEVRRTFDGRESSREEELVVLTRDGESRIWSFSSSAPGRLPDGRRFLVAMASDVTERRQAEEALRESQERLRLAIEVTGLGTWDFNPMTGRMRWSTRCKEIHGLPPEAEVDYGELLLRVHPDDWDRVHQAIQDALDPASSGNYEVEYRAVAPGGVRWVVSRGRAFFHGEGADRHAVRFIGTAMDVTERKQHEEELHQAKEEAEQANRAKDQFLATLSHELRTPLTPVLALVSGLEGDERLREVADRLAMIRRNVELEARLIDDLLDLTRIARGRLELQRGITDVKAVVEHAIQICCAEDVEAGRLTVVTDFAAQEHRVWGDASRLTQIFWNLLRNAVKFTPEGGTIFVRSWIQMGECAGETLVMEVADTGVGIEPGALPHIFKAFEQGPAAGGRSLGGLGLGLSISQAIAELHGGHISARSQGYGQGATFRVHLPAGSWPADARSVPLPAPEVSAAPALGAGAPLRLLIVEDHADTAEAMAELLRAMGYDVKVAGSVAEGLAAAAGAERSGAAVDLVISDLGLPDGTGLDLMRELGSRYGLRGIALSGYGTEEDVRRSLEAGFCRHLTKPVSVQALETAIHEAAARVEQ